MKKQNLLYIFFINLSLFYAGSVQLAAQGTHSVLSPAQAVWSNDTATLFADWRNYYQQHLGLTIDCEKISIPLRPDGNVRLLFIAKGVTLGRMWDAWKFPKWSYVSHADLEKMVTVNARSPKKQGYWIWVQAGGEPDQEFLGKSAEQADPRMNLGMTLLERMLLESKYFQETGNHLDKGGITLCSGSRDRDGLVLRVQWCATHKGVDISGYSQTESYKKYGIRKVTTF